MQRSRVAEPEFKFSRSGESTLFYLSLLLSLLPSPPPPSPTCLRWR
jgi:hypothetical protein